MRIVNSWLGRSARVALGFVVVVTTLASVAHASGPLPPPVAPEIDPGSIGSALTLLMGGALMLTGRSRKS